MQDWKLSVESLNFGMIPGRALDIHVVGFPTKQGGIDLAPWLAQYRCSLSASELLPAASLQLERVYLVSSGLRVPHPCSAEMMERCFLNFWARIVAERMGEPKTFVSMRMDERALNTCLTSVVGAGYQTARRERMLNGSGRFLYYPVRQGDEIAMLFCPGGRLSD